MKRGKIKILMVCFIGSILEWYDFALFGVFASLISHLFFPHKNSIDALLLTFAIFGCGYLTRPLGALIYGHIGDKYGRRRALASTILLMTGTTCIIGLLPTYNSIGILAPIMLIIARLLQGLSASGEYPGAITFLGETATDKTRGFLGSFSAGGAMCGFLLGFIVGGLITAFCSKSALYAWVWRIPFLVSIMLGGIGFYLRYKLQETAVFKQLSVNHRVKSLPVLSFLKDQKLRLLALTGVLWGKELSFYLIFVYLPMVLIHIRQFSAHRIFLINSINTFVIILLMPIFGILSDRIGRTRLVLISVVSLVLLTYPIFHLFNSNSLAVIFIGQFIFAILVASFLGPMPAITSDMFSAEVRYTGAAISVNLSSAIFGGMTPFIAMYMVKTTGSMLSPCFYAIFAFLIAVIAICYIRGKHKAGSFIENLDYEIHSNY
jgi:MHS family proline/betaine transporter-like MFS transporter